MLPPRLQQALERALGSAVVDAQRVSGGDIHQAYKLTLASGARVFVKSSADTPPRMFELEAHGLAWLGDAGALRVPRVLAAQDGNEAFLALEWIEPGAPARDYDEQLGRGLAALHRAGAARFGLDRDNYLATLPQDNRASDSWPRFYAEQRLRPLLARAVAQKLASARMRQGLERVCEHIDALCGPDEPPARLHGDLWSGNALCTSTGEPVLIDPAVYGGHREVDLAMMRLFGGFGARCFAAYDEAFPLADGHEARVALYQLYPLLVHVVLFGGGYVSRVEQALRALV